jgi:hypothetical protein
MLGSSHNGLALYRASLQPIWTNRKSEDISLIEQYFEHRTSLPITSFPVVLSQEI